MKYYIKTFGCQMNISDSERIAGFLELHKFKPAKDINSADLVVFNTCGVRQMAEDRVYGQIHNLAYRRSRIVDRKIILTGCLANRKDVRGRLKDKVDLFCEIKEFPEKISNFQFQVSNQAIISNDLISKKNNNSKLNISKFNQNSKFKIRNYLNIQPKYSTPYSAYVPIMTGCNNFCSYCVVPYARGREVSRPMENIIKEVKALVKNGYGEIFLLGQNVNSYKDKKTNFSKLLKKINAITGNFWIHFLSNHPKDVTDEMIETAAKCEKVCECFHLPIQSGSNEILRKMNRKYTAKQYLKLVDKIKKAYQKYKPDALFAITSDIIVGFPGETKKQFLDSAKIMKKVGYDMIFFGQYSPRPGTASWNLKDNISKAEKVRREKYLNEILKITAYENNQKYVGKVLEVLVIKTKPSDRQGLALNYFGRTRTMKNVKLESKQKNLNGKIVKVKITKANTWNLEGKAMKV
jgi:tRNA-2-methylthio-N6-dimethylallyladenosine synthase